MKARPNSAAAGNGCLAFLESRVGTILVVVLVPLLLCLGLALPPISLPSRIMSIGYVNFTASGAEAKDPDGAIVRIPQGAVAKSGAIKINPTPSQAFSSSAAAKSLPAYLEVKSPYYGLALQGERPKTVELLIPIPNDSDPTATLDLWAQYNQAWFKIPFVLNQQDNQIDSVLNFTPDGVVVVQTKAQTPVVGAMLQSRNAPPDQASQVISELNPLGLHLADEGGVAGDVLALPETSAASPYSLVPTVMNSDETGVRTDLTENMLADSKLRTQHITTLVDLAVQKLYMGYNIQYDGLTTADQEGFTAFIKELAQQLHAQNKILSVSLPAPTPISETEWDTAGYDWALIGRYADEVKIPMLTDTKAYEGDPPLVDQYLLWATEQIDRNKLQVVVSTQGRDETTAGSTPVRLGDALKLLGPVNVPQQVAPGAQVILDLPKLRDMGGIQHHDPSGTFYFNYKDDKGTAHTVWLENADSLSKKTALLLKYNLRGIALQNIEGDAAPDPNIWTVLQQYRALQAASFTSKLSVVWLVDGNALGKVSTNDPKLAMTVPNVTGQHTIDIALSLDEAQSWQAAGDQVVVNVLQPTPTPT
ncbi:MAG: glycosyl hydrolase family 18 protein, partial [Anaerolineae bacterium]